jgi:hypothetical protein
VPSFVRSIAELLRDVSQQTVECGSVLLPVRIAAQPSDVAQEFRAGSFRVKRLLAGWAEIKVRRQFRLLVFRQAAAEQIADHFPTGACCLNDHREPLSLFIKMR